MKLKEIDKSIYRKHLNIVIVGFISSLLLLALIYGQLLILAFSDANTAIMAVSDLAEQVGAETSSNFRYNFLGVILALLSCGVILSKLRHTVFFSEVYYVWQIKQQQNSIYRKLKLIKAAADIDDVNALIILNFYYASLKQIYLLDDNTLTMSALDKDSERLQQKIQALNLELTTEQFEQSLLSAYK